MSKDTESSKTKDSQPKGTPKKSCNPFKWLWKQVVGLWEGMKFWKFDERDRGIWIASSNVSFVQFLGAAWLWSNWKLLLAKTALFSKTFVSTWAALS